MNEQDYESAFAIIAYAGNAKSNAMLAIRAAREGDFAKSQELLVAADDDLVSSHKTQTQMLTEEARGNPVKVNVILVHAQDHLSGAILVRSLADEFIHIYERLQTAVTSTPMK
ncbi:PTS lactose/cellobiose transporter subunit IIA [Cryobacterium sp. 10S3]|uniref:PTS lactose/cellobiose transporter subunit IIA n=1 Tax=Cryobacterium sp. 10S3 TaxID=3048582 RepID=UPI002AC936DA|nr:PTS lactose/cellobiose transporter subunit IIA [Cryobacterium sp. 10S3]MEB0287494.1 PTS lactose/cellobiose transporter subunit IIA [Cryobacterium sp. 10S3]WPX13282.1 PTS lactose/cellobiose transporter subunit IIA [Cryobacterium sp. 10S3]